MILKIERYSGNQQWWVIDNVRKYSLSTAIKKQYPLNSNNYDAILLDIEHCTCKKDDECSSCSYYYVLICRLEDGSEYIIAFDTICYVLNDDGKTIEKIVANYNEKK